MATFVLVHGGWIGGSIWTKVATLLRAAGHTVYAPTLTGMGETAHLLSPAVGLETHIADVIGLLTYEDLREVTLVGHSYGGMVITGVANQVTDRLAHLVYLDAFVPADGQCLLDLQPEVRERFLGVATAQGDGWRIPPGPPERYGVTEEPDRSWFGARITAQPLLTFLQPVRFTAALTYPRTYIRCAASGSMASPFHRFGERARTDPAWRYRELATGHGAMLSLPRETADLLLEAATRHVV
jgi:pimeloyl-ACP methyl ester carboxylesterase